MIETFSGSHRFRPACLVGVYEEWMDDEYDNAADLHDRAIEFVAGVVELLDSGKCPRCNGPLVRSEREYPAGSRLTHCRCIPVCGPCGLLEAILPLSQQVLLPEWGKEDAVAREAEVVNAIPIHWPTTDPVTEQSAGSILSLIGDWKERDDGGMPDGWVKYGYDVSADQEERKR